MRIEQKIQKPYMIKLGIWSAVVIMLCLICVFYHSSPNAQFEPVVTFALIILISFILFTALGLLGYFTDNSFSGEIVDMKVDVRYHKESAFDKPISVICPICGALHPLGTKTCSFCENELPYDPNRR